MNQTFEFIKGIKNTLADSLFYLVNLDLTEMQALVPPFQEFGYFVFDDLPNIETTPLTVNAITTCESKPQKVTVQFDLSEDKLKELQQQDTILYNNYATLKQF